MVLKRAVWAAAVTAVFCAGCGDKSDENPDAPADTTFIDSRDYRTYRKVTAGTQTWMGENLNYNAFHSVCYEERSDNCAKYGRLYDWATAMDIDASYNSSHWNGSDVKHQGICPAGWHLPSGAEWDTLVYYAGGDSTAGKKLKSASGWKDNGNGTDDYGFSALPGGGKYAGFGNAGLYGDWWSATETERDAGKAMFRDMDYDNDMVDRDTVGMDKAYLFSVRCVRD